MTNIMKRQRFIKLSVKKSLKLKINKINNSFKKEENKRKQSFILKIASDFMTAILLVPKNSLCNIRKKSKTGRYYMIRRSWCKLVLIF